MNAPLKSALFILLATSMEPAPAADEEPAAASTPYGYRVIASYPHDPEAFTQGLLFADGKLYESTGGYGQSSVRILDLASGRVLRERRLPDNRFGEGLALSGGRLHQLTWKAGIGFTYEASTLTPIGEFRYKGEGWGTGRQRGQPRDERRQRRAALSRPGHPDRSSTPSRCATARSRWSA